MTESPEQAADDNTPEDREESSEAMRMPFGEHLEELRSCLIRAMAGLSIGTVLALVYGQEIIVFICQPLLIIQQGKGIQPSLQILAPMAGFTAYLKIGFLSGLIVTMPWVLYQLWSFVATGLYPREQKFVRRLMVPSVGLFAAGVMFLYYIVLPLVLNFFISFNQQFGLPDLEPTLFQSWLLPDSDSGEDDPSDAGTATDPPTGESASTGSNAEGTAATPVNPVPALKIPTFLEDPTKPELGQMWVNKTTGRLTIMTGAGLQSVRLDRSAGSTAIQSQFALDYYISFVLMLALAFGIAFETPIVVFFLAWTGLVPAAAMARARRYVLLGMIALAAIMTPPDVISQLLLAGPMYILFEIGLFVARLTEKRAAEQADAE